MKTAEELIAYSQRYNTVGHADWTESLEGEFLARDDCDYTAIDDETCTFRSREWEVMLHGERDTD